MAYAMAMEADCRDLVIRSIASFLAITWMASVYPGFVRQQASLSTWWIDVRPLDRRWADALLFIASLVLIAWSIRPRMCTARRNLTRGLFAILLAISLWNAFVFFHLWIGGRVQSSFPLPFSLILAALAGGLLFYLGTRRPSCAAPRSVQRQSLFARRLPWNATTLVTCCIAWPLMLMFCFGKTDYRRPADAVVVLGARAYADGQPSVALADRVRTACRLYHAGLAPTLVFSGGPGDGRVHETESMKRLAMSLEVPEAAIVLDADGLNTAATARFVTAKSRDRHWSRVLVVSHFYHLPRTKLACLRAGVDVLTVPAEESYTLTRMPWLMAREVIAFWKYALDPHTLNS